MDNFIYFDNAATTPLRKEVLDEMLPYLTEFYGNASSIYKIGQASRVAIDSAREKVADILGATPREIIFTSCGSESDNWAIKGYAMAHKKRGNHIITTKIEHHAVLHTCEYLEKKGFEVTYLDVDEYGLISLEQLESAIRPETILITVMYANNEIGTIQPIKEIADIAHKHDIVFHTDAVQAVGSVPINVKELGVDMLSLSAHKFNGPKGIGAMYIKRSLYIENFMHGGAQEFGKRAGTENTANIVGLAKALEISTTEMDKKISYLTELRDYIIENISAKIPYCRLNGHASERLPGNVNFSFEFIEGESLLLMLNMNGIAASSGSACTSGSLDPSHVLLAIGLPHEEAHGSLRVSLGYQNTYEEADKLIEVLPGIVQRLRDMSPLYENIERK